MWSAVIYYIIYFLDHFRNKTTEKVGKNWKGLEQHQRLKCGCNLHKYAEKQPTEEALRS